MKKALPPEVLATVENEGALGHAAWKRGDLEEAESHFLRLWEAIPEPKLEFDRAGILARGVTVFYRDTRQFDKAKAWLPLVSEAYGPSNPLPNFLAGTVYFESGDLDRAFELFHKLYAEYGARPFQGNEQYLAFYLHRARNQG